MNALSLIGSNATTINDLISPRTVYVELNL